MHSSLSGGTGSGVMTLLLERLGFQFDRKTLLINNLLYSNNYRHSPNIVEAYNAVLSTGALLEHSSLVMVNTNHGLSNHCQEHQGIETPSLRQLNSLNSQAMSHLVLGSPSLRDIRNNLVPYSRINFVLPAYKEVKHTCESGDVESVTKELFQPHQYLCHTDY